MAIKGEIAFTPQQLALIERAGSQYVEACPGAGKTQAIAERFIRRPNAHPRKGVALLSFTNAAADEAHRRCIAQPGFLIAPNFIGTIDKFINRFIVSPTLAAQAMAPSRFVDVWSQLPHASVRSKGVDVNATLDWFEFDKDGNAKLVIGRAPAKSRQSLEDLDRWKIDKLQDRATTVIKLMHSRGYHDSDSSRRVAIQALSDSPTRKLLTELLVSRFSEVIVDEVQDCSDGDAEILQWVRESGVELVLVGDPDQAIYGFRGRSTDAGKRITSLVPAGDRLSGNFRSTPAICQLANSLRSTSTGTDQALGKYKSNSQPVLLYKYSQPTDLARYAQTLSDTNGLSREQSVVLSHGTSQAAQCAGGSVPAEGVTGRLARIAVAIECLQNESSSGNMRKQALADLSICLHESSVNELKELPRFELLDALATTEREHMAAVMRLAFSLSLDRRQLPSVFKQDLVAALKANGFYWVRVGAIPAPKKWPSLPSNKTALLDHGSIHSFKGLQRELVVMVIPKSGNRPDESTGVGQWCTDVPGEERRVLYVGATRAAKLLLLAVHKSQYERVRSKLATDCVPYLEVEG